MGEIPEEKVISAFERCGRKQTEIAEALYPILADALEIGDEGGLGFGNPLLVPDGPGGWRFCIRLRETD